MEQNLNSDKFFRSPNQFSMMITKLAKVLRLTYIDTIVHYCDEKEIDIEDITKLINRSLKERIEVEAQDLNIIQKTSRLPI